MESKPFKTLDEQIEILKSRGLIINDYAQKPDHTSRLRFAPSRCMLSPDTTINKQRCCAAVTNNKGHALASKLADMAFIIRGHFVTAVYLSCAWLVITHIPWKFRSLYEL